MVTELNIYILNYLHFKTKFCFVFFVFPIAYILSIVIFIFELSSAGMFCVYQAVLQKLGTSVEDQSTLSA